MIILDCGTGLQDPAAKAALATCDQIVLVTDAVPATASLVAEAGALLAASGRPITVVVNKMPKKSRLGPRQAGHLRAGGERHARPPPGPTRPEPTFSRAEASTGTMRPNPGSPRCASWRSPWWAIGHILGLTLDAKAAP